MGFILTPLRGLEQTELFHLGQAGLFRLELAGLFQLEQAGLSTCRSRIVLLGRKPASPHGHAFEGLKQVSFTMEDVHRRSLGVVSSALAVLSMTGATVAQRAARNQPLPDCGPLAGQVLRCPKAGFTYKVPFGWVNRTEDMQESASGAAAKSDKNTNQGDAETGKTLLAVFERPPGASGESVNSAVIIAVEDRAAYPAVKTAADYFGPLSDIAEQRGFKMDGDPYSFSVGSKQVVRGDFTGGDEKNPIRQTSLVLLEKGYILSFTFLAGSDDEIDSLIEYLTFNSSARKTSSK